MLLILASASRSRGQGVESAERVTAAFVAGSPQFVEWPTEVLEGRDELEICVWEPDPFDETLEELLRMEVLDGRPLRERRINRPSMIDGCHVLYVPSITRRIRSLLSVTEGRPVLTIGEAPDFLERGGIVRLQVVERRIRFEVNADAAARAGLRLSSDFLSLAADVRGEP